MYSYLSVTSGPLEVGIETAGPQDGWPVLLLHGFPYDPHSYSAVAVTLASAGARVLVPYLRGFGPTRFTSAATQRSGQQAAIGRDVLQLIDTLSLKAPIVVGFDWGGRAACVAAALSPGHIGGVVALGGDSIQDIASSSEPAPPWDENLDWYQYYFHGERGRAGLTRYRRELAMQLWSEWSPERAISGADFERAAGSFDNPDFVEVVIHSYRHRFGLAPGAPEYDEDEHLLAQLPTIDVPAIVIDPTQDPMITPRTRDEHTARFTRLIDHRLSASGHNQPFDAPLDVALAVQDLHRAIVEPEPS
ncbi:alpha/beta hydrolase [Salinibacterium sp. G-O1]|nr:alpha/beta hydrolase [Salinibacterium sp. G-O1]MDJ0334031.1 alpha/beta hydrolase [Salinibacterium sp. G-O1]